MSLSLRMYFSVSMMLFCPLAENSGSVIYNERPEPLEPKCAEDHHGASTSCRDSTALPVKNALRSRSAQVTGQ